MEGSIRQSFGRGLIGPGLHAWMVDFDRRMSQEEFAARNSTLVKSGRLEPLFEAMDGNGDGAVVEEELLPESA